MLLEQFINFAFKTSNNQVEYESLMVGMCLAKTLGARGLLA